MSFLGGIGGGRRPVPNAPTADNRKLEKARTQSSIIRSAKWGRDRAGINDSVSMIITLNKAPQNSNARVEVIYNAPGKPPHGFDNPITIPISGMAATGYWRTKAPKMNNWTRGYFTFRVWVDGQMATSEALMLTDDPVARAVQRINSDGFDR